MIRLSSLLPIAPIVLLAEQQRRKKTHCNFSSATYPANNPTEDRFFTSDDNNWKIAAVFDGHGGWQVAEFVSKNILGVVLENLKDVSETDEVTVDIRILKSFNTIENKVIESARPAFQQGYGEVAGVGSCALLAIKKANRLIVANSGDCQAILGSAVNVKNEHSTRTHYVATRISREHNARIPLEVLNLVQSHPGEKDVVKCKTSQACYVKGRLQLTRAFGDLYLKHEEFNGTADRKRGKHIRQPYTPPYVTHVPDLHHVRLDGKSDKFVVIASDGVWDFLSEQQAVDIVASCLGSESSEAEAAQLVVDRALEIAASQRGWSVHQLRALPQGEERRRRHDDTTAVVMYF